MVDKYEYISSIGCNFTAKNQSNIFWRGGTCPISNNSIASLTWSAVISNPRPTVNNPILAVLVLLAVQW